MWENFLGLLRPPCGLILVASHPLMAWAQEPCGRSGATKKQQAKRTRRQNADANRAARLARHFGSICGGRHGHDRKILASLAAQIVARPNRLQDRRMRDGRQAEAC
jgi:hypothetical protein